MIQIRTSYVGVLGPRFKSDTNCNDFLGGRLLAFT